MGGGGNGGKKKNPAPRAVQWRKKSRCAVPAKKGRGSVCRGTDCYARGAKKERKWSVPDGAWFSGCSQGKEEHGHQ